MNLNLTSPLASEFFSSSLPAQDKEPLASVSTKQGGASDDQAEQEGHQWVSRFAPYVAFFVAVFASVAAAAAVVSNDMPVMVIGLL